MSKGRLFVISGASGVGKSTVLKRVLDSKENITFSVSATTRAPREGEQDGVNYYFVSHETRIVAASTARPMERLMNIAPTTIAPVA